MDDIIAQLKAIRIPFESEQDSDGIWHSWPVDAPGLWGQGQDRETSIDDMIDMWREGVEIIAKEHIQPSPALLYAKVLISTNEELRQCLAGEICAVS